MTRRASRMRPTADHLYRMSGHAIHAGGNAPIASDLN